MFCLGWWALIGLALQPRVFAGKKEINVGYSDHTGCLFVGNAIANLSPKRTKESGLQHNLTQKNKAQMVIILNVSPPGLAFRFKEVGMMQQAVS